MIRLVPAAVLLVGLSGCARALGYAGTHPGEQDLDCKGKVSLSITSSGAISAVYGGANVGVTTVVGDCGDGFHLGRWQGMPSRVPAPAK